MTEPASCWIWVQCLTVRANLLGVPQGSCAFYHQRRTRTEDGRIYEYTCSYIRGDRVTLDVHMRKNNMTFNRTVR